mgnify:CR=1 FL=1
MVRPDPTRIIATAGVWLAWQERRRALPLIARLVLLRGSAGTAWLTLGLLGLASAAWNPYLTATDVIDVRIAGQWLPSFLDWFLAGMADEMRAEHAIALDAVEQMHAEYEQIFAARGEDLDIRIAGVERLAHLPHARGFDRVSYLVKGHAALFPIKPAKIKEPLDRRSRNGCAARRGSSPWKASRRVPRSRGSSEPK